MRRSLDFISFMFSAFGVGLFEKRADVVVATSPQFFAAIGGWALAKIRGVPFVFELGDLWPASIIAVGAMRAGFLLRLIERVELFLYGQSSSIVSLTNSFKQNLVARGVPANKIAVVRNGVDLWRYNPQNRDSHLAKIWNLEKKFVLGYVGTHGMAHALKNVLDAAELLKGYKDVRFLLVGSGAERNFLIESAQKRNLSNVIFAPAQPKESMPGVWSLCDVALVHLKDAPLFKGVIPSKIFEAMAMGVPILLVSPKGEASKIICQENVGLHIAPEAPRALADAVQTLYADGSTRKAFGQRGQRASVLYSREMQARHMIGVLELVILGKGGEVASLSPIPKSEF